MTSPDKAVLTELKLMLDRLAGELVAAAHVDDVFWQIQAIIDSNAEINEADVFQDWIAITYVDSIAIRLRRLVDPRKDSISLHRLLELMKPTAEHFSRERFVGKWPDRAKDIGHKRFDTIAGVGAHHLTVNAFTGKQETLRSAMQRVRHYANKTVAHTATVPPTRAITQEDVLGRDHVRPRR